MPTLQELLQTCEDDTRDVIGNEAADRLGKWKWRRSQADLVKYVQQLIHGKRRDNGRKLHLRGKLSLEKIVLDHCPELFTTADREQAKKTLGIPK